ncbi:MAG: replicative DNA helicase [Bacteroidetes bacterium]|nr:replicative DNA helicase [Bacteroidota bacterium]MBL7105801.1 replicative DNA helicase [Bacteroidales bacterium]
MKEKKQDLQYQAKNKTNIKPYFQDQGKLPPQAVDLEEAVLGACMLEYDAYNNIGHILNPECFYKESHQIIYSAIEALSSKSKPIDILTVTDQLKTTGELEFIGGAYYITQLTGRVASSTNIEYHSMIVYQKYVQREMIIHSSRVIQFAFDDTGFEDAIQTYYKSTEVIDNLLAGRRSDRTLANIMEDYEKELDRRMKLFAEGCTIGIKTGIVFLNKITHGWKPGELIIVAGRPGMGKTAVGLNLFAKNAAEQNKNILFFSLEMDEFPLLDRLTCSYGGIDPNFLKSGEIKNYPDQLSKFQETKQKLKSLPFSIDDNAYSDIKHITTVSRAKNRKGKCDMVVIDYLQLIETSQSKSNSYFKNREREVSEMTRSLKRLAKELKIPVILLAQLNRSVESRNDKRPVMSDLRESGSIEQDADIIIFPFRPEYYKIMEDDQQNSTEGVMIFIVAKNRNGKITGDVYAQYSPDLTQFFDYDHNNESESEIEKAPY